MQEGVQKIYDFPRWEVRHTYKHLEIVQRIDFELCSVYEPQTLKEVYSFLEKNDLEDYAIIDTRKNDFLIPFGVYSFIDKFEDDLAIVKKGRYTKECFNAIKDLPPWEAREGLKLTASEWSEAVERHQSSILEVKNNVIGYGLINDKGDEIIEAIYDSVTYYPNNGHPKVVLSQDGGVKEVFLVSLKSKEEFSSLFQVK